MKDAAINCSAWLGASLVAIALALVPSDSVIVGTEYLPFGNDSFYHARRILDAAFSENGLYQFDPRIHVAEGSWVTWPWGYDFFLARVLEVFAWAAPMLQPMQVLVYVPVVWLPINAALLLTLATTLGIRAEFRVMILIAFSLMPLTQKLHGIGAIDHHYMELTFVLLSTWLFLRVLAPGAGRHAAIMCGIGLGLAHLVHHGLFVLQIPVLATTFILWLRSAMPKDLDLQSLAIALTVSTLLVALPSGPLLDGHFSFSTLSWFHPYVALCSAVLLVLMHHYQYSRRTLYALLATGLVLAVPVAGGILMGAQFLTGSTLALDTINEVVSPLGMISGDWGLSGTVQIYSWLLLPAPILIVGCLWLAATTRSPQALAFAVCSVFGLSLLMMQFRLNYFGLGFLLCAPFYLLNEQPRLSGRYRAVTALGATVVLALAFQPPLSGALFRSYPLSGDHLYHNVRPLLASLQQACLEAPGIVVANRHYGHHIRFHTECSVIANNFLLTRQHAEKVMAVDLLFTLSPQELADRAPDARYILAVLNDAYEQNEGMTVLRSFDNIAARNPQLIRSLLFADAPPQDIEVLQTVQAEDRDGRSALIAGLYRLHGEQR